MNVIRYLILTSVFVASSASADWGEGQIIYEEEPLFVYEGAGDISVTGASLTNAGTILSAPSAKTSNSATMSGVPADAQLLKAYLVWAASGPEANSLSQVIADDDATLQLPNGTTLNVDAAPEEVRKWQGSATVPGLLTEYELNLGYYNVVTDITETLLDELGEGDDLNGTYTVSGVDIHECANGFDTTDVFCSFHLTMGAWSLVLFYDSPNTVEVPRRLYFYDGLGMFDADYPGVSTVEVSDFIAADTPNGALYAMFPFSIDNGANGDKFTMNGCDLQNTCNDAASDLINGSTSAMGNCSGSTFGIDLDAFNVGGAMNPGDTSATITMNSGTDTFITTYMALVLDVKFTGGNAGGGDGPCNEGSSNGSSNGNTDGTSDGSNDGSNDGTNDGSNDGANDGTSDGTSDGSNDGISDGTSDGVTEGSSEGTGQDSTCSLNSDCPPLHRCELGTCIQDCAASRDCPNEGDICNSNGQCVSAANDDGAAVSEGGCDCQSNQIPGANFYLALIFMAGLRWRKKFWI